MKIVRLATGFAIGYVLGSRAGRDKYEQIVAKAREVQDHPAVAQAKQKAKQLLGTTTDTAAPGSAPSITETVSASGNSALPDTSTTHPSPSTVSRSARRGPSSSRPSPSSTADPLAPPHSA